MWFASIWIFTFKIPWQLGAAFMYHHLLDGDPASNTLSWRWVAGLHTKGKTYLARADNIAKYSEGRWNPRESDLATAAFHIEDELAPTGKEGLAFPPLKPTPNTGLLLTSDDLSIDTVLDLTRYRSVCIFTPQGQELTPLKRSFIDEAIQDALSRIAVPCGEGFARTIQLSSEALSWREANNLDAIEIVAPHVGPLRSAVRELASSLTIAQLPIGFLERSWDSTLFPLCDKGFFTMWERFKKRWATKGELAGTCPLIAL
jgi:deoxyribodipyrimidine photo-lyase